MRNSTAPDFIARTDIGMIAMACDEDDRKLHVRAHEGFLKVQTALLRKSDVEDKAGGAIRRTSGGSDLRKKVGNGRK